MRCNFFKEHSSVFSILDWWLEFLIFWFYGVVGASLYFGLISNFIDKSVVVFVLYLILYIPIRFILLFYNIYRRNKSYYNSAGEFTANNLKDWYALNPKRFIFCLDNFGFHYKVVGGTQYIDENKMVEKDIVGYKYIIPKTFKDYLYYIVFTEKLFFHIQKNDKKLEKIKNQKKSNDELLAVLNVVQSDILKVMEDSQNTINKEVEKLEELSK